MNTQAQGADKLMQTDTARLLGVTLALAGEVFLLKAELERLRNALLDSGATSPEQIAAAGQGDKLKAWMRVEENEFTASILRPFLHPDQVPDVSHLIEGR